MSDKPQGMPRLPSVSSEFAEFVVDKGLPPGLHSPRPGGRDQFPPPSTRISKKHNYRTGQSSLSFLKSVSFVSGYFTISTSAVGTGLILTP